MNEAYIEVSILVADNELKEVLIARLETIGFYGFEENEDHFKAYIGQEKFYEDALNDLLKDGKINYSKSIIKNQNWNQLWESNFEPVTVEDFVGIRADFHQPMTGVEHEIVITPKMSFGTGHHATTWLVMQSMQAIDFKHKTVFDFGTGTGILAILAEKLGAQEVLAVDNDPWCIENASENIITNRCLNINIQQVNSAKLDQQFDIILANINRHIILENLPFLYTSLASNGKLILSGLLTDDEKDICAACAVSGFRHLKTVQRNGWIAIRLCKK